MYLTELLVRCSDVEARVGRLYRALSERFASGGEMARLWRELAFEEEIHAGILRRELESFEQVEDAGAYLPEYAPRLEHVLQVLDDLEERTLTLETLDDALVVAMALEQAELEDLYDDLVVQGYPAFKLISERLESVSSAPPAPPRSKGSPRPARRRSSRSAS